MDIPVADRPRARMETLRLLVRLRMDRDQQRMWPDSLKLPVAGLSFAAAGRWGTDLLDFGTLADFQRWLDARDRLRS